MLHLRTYLWRGNLTNTFYLHWCIYDYIFKYKRSQVFFYYLNYHFRLLIKIEFLVRNHKALDLDIWCVASSSELLTRLFKLWSHGQYWSHPGVTWVTLDIKVCSILYWPSNRLFDLLTRINIGPTWGHLILYRLL